MSKRPRRALFSFITIPFRLPQDDPLNLRFSVFGVARCIVKVLNELGYIVDLIEYNDTKFKPRRNYDIFIGHGGYNFDYISSYLAPSTIKIYFSTSIYWRLFNQKEKNRFEQLEKRRKVCLPYDRLITHSEESANQTADGIICLGNEYAKTTFSNFPLVITLNNAAYPNNFRNKIKKDFHSARRNYLFFAGNGNVHKGLDLLLEAFINVDEHLYICQNIDPGFHEAFKDELENHQNIHLIGSIPMRGRQYYDLISKCAFVILPSCAEGSAGSVVECMHHGLIPVVSQESTIDTNGFGITLRTCNIVEIINVVKDVSQRSPDWCEEMSKKTRHAAITEYSEDAFLRNMKNAIQVICGLRAARLLSKIRSL